MAKFEDFTWGTKVRHYEHEGVVVELDFIDSTVRVKFDEDTYRWFGGGRIESLFALTIIDDKEAVNEYDIINNSIA